MVSSSENAQRTAQHWASHGTMCAGRGISWLELPAVQHRQNAKVSGKPNVDWVRYTLEHCFEGRLPLARCLSLGCGRGGLERRLAEYQAFVACDAHDLSKHLITEAQRLAQEAGYDHIHYEVHDANRIQLPRAHYDTVWAVNILHHVERLEHLLSQIAASLKRGGLFILKEYVGPNRFQFSVRQRQIIRSCYEIIPVEYRLLRPAAFESNPSPRGWDGWAGMAFRLVEKLREGDLWQASKRYLWRKWVARSRIQPVKNFSLPTASSVRAVDPSEAVRSAEILPLLRHYFEIVEFKPLGGSILQFLLADIAGNFHDETGRQLLEMLFAIEDTLLACGELQSDFVYIVASPSET